MNDDLGQENTEDAPINEENSISATSDDNYVQVKNFITLFTQMTWIIMNIFRKIRQQMTKVIHMVINT